MTTLFQVLCSNEVNVYTGGLTNLDLAHLGKWASSAARDCKAKSDREYKRAFSLIREGADLLLRQRTLGEAGALAWVAENPSMADLTQNPKESTTPLSEANNG